MLGSRRAYRFCEQCADRGIRTRVDAPMSICPVCEGRSSEPGGEVQGDTACARRRPSLLKYVLACLGGVVVGAIGGLIVGCVLVLLYSMTMDRYTFSEAGYAIIGLALIIFLPLGAIIGGAFGISMLSRHAKRADAH